ncbi:conserved hypothetical protein [Vibrio nigripulchritudo SO65]|uniref:DUF3283 family protein n=1 Tax=Vibrio nigripulchritudo TaxID=28173 RepID=UPI0003B1F28B|nr:DUF3283 family protein [Vibrio nigripulchritudo]CCN33923.1 conserved hypothetical protein [Vibrio nigripulchritudo AM115]CCN43759.1 conserved hypothetical protein [Vibrio nigripulchritudo FTn2]CCN65203.1 conserved hypothetical protein [Vibrio nigripulchritudo POn4]CCN79007.1 conserved hypothetical protein [Vibrio nigripulchritudo SO65]
MSFNLSLLPSEEKNAIEIDKQASFLVWKIKQAQAGPEVLTEHKATLRLESEIELFEQSVEKYKRVMGVA